MDHRSLLEAANITDPIERARILTRLMTEDLGLTDAAARYRRQAIAEARDAGYTREQIAAALGVSPPRITQISKGPAAKAPEPPATEPPRVLVQRSLPTPPSVRGSLSLYLVEAEHQGIAADRKMLYIGPEPAADHVASSFGSLMATTSSRAASSCSPTLFRFASPPRSSGSTCSKAPGLPSPSLFGPPCRPPSKTWATAFGRAEESLISRRPTLFERETLDLEPDEWIVQILRTSFSTENTPIHTLETICAASRHIFPIGQVAGTDQF